MKRQDEQEMKMLYLEWKDSGRSKADFASEKGIVRTTFYYWTTRFTKQENLSSIDGEFRQLELPNNDPAPSGRVVARISYPSGISLDLYGPVSADLVRELVR
ncbi:hypothetical protein [Cyclobacterium sp.]|uniref:IS66 family insertion sequence element accessory protein TnpA n=1 Tax=Cyclobacterium sp. TaxID=1966343 RepID=UPI0019874D90|nr:hypothetical protein [Cyclobacterium sp.]MBD3631309.1 hypothetical protein [Cyclobacterium sp.]